MFFIRGGYIFVYNNGVERRPESEASPSDDQSPFSIDIFNDLNKSYVWWVRAGAQTGYFNDCRVY